VYSCFVSSNHPAYCHKSFFAFCSGLAPLQKT
jgi:hypothetical protein